MPCVPVIGLTETSVAPCTVIETLLLVPAGLLTVTVCVPTAAVVPLATANVAVSVVGLVTLTALTVIPLEEDTATLVPVAVKLVPVKVTEVVVVPRTNVLGATETSVGRGGLTTVNVTVLVVPPGVTVTLTVLADRLAPAVMVNVALTVVSFTTARLLEVTPVPDTVIAVVPVRPLPVRVTGTLVARVPELGAIADSTGPSTVNVCALLAPPPFVTLTFLALTVAVAEIVNVAVIVVEFTTVIAPTVTPVPDTVTVVPVAVKLAPVSVTGTLVLRCPLLGVTDASVGVAGLATVSAKLCTAFVPIPLLAVKVMLYVAAVPAAGVPLNTCVAALNETPVGSAPASLRVGAGLPVAVTVKDPAAFTVNAALLALVIAGACVGSANFAVTLCGAFMVTVVEALVELGHVAGPIRETVTRIRRCHEGNCRTLRIVAARSRRDCPAAGWVHRRC